MAGAPPLTVSRLEIEFLSPGFRHQPRHCDPGKLCNLDGRWIQSVHRSRANRFVSAGLGPLEPSQPRCRLRRLLTRLYLSPDSEGKSSGPSRPFRSGRPLLDLGLFEAFCAADVCCFTVTIKSSKLNVGRELLEIPRRTGCKPVFSDDRAGDLKCTGGSETHSRFEFSTG